MTWLTPAPPRSSAVGPWWRDPGLAAGVLWALVVLAFNTAATNQLGQVTGTLVACPLLAAGMVQRVWRVLPAAGFALVTLATSAAIRDTPFGIAQHVRVGGLVVATLVALVVARARLTQRAQLVTMGEIARVAQETILRPIPRRIDGFEIETRYVSAGVDASVGGDGYELADTPFGPRLLVADVRGKGLEATRTMALVLGAFREWAHQEEQLDGLLVRLHESVSRELVDGDFVTALVAQLASDRLTFASAGHPPPFRGQDGTVEWLDCQPSPPLGLLDMDADPGSDGVCDVVVESRRLCPGDLLAFVTDGLLEPHERGGDILPWQQLVRPMADAGQARRELTATAEAMVDVAQRWTAAGLLDDAALVLCRVLPAVDR